MNPRRAVAVPLGRRVLYALLTTLVALGIMTAGFAVLERVGMVNSYRQDDSTLYLQGEYLKVNASVAPPVYEIRDAQFPNVVQDSFPAKKGSGTFRIFITGGSFVRGGHHFPPGTPPLGYGTISDWMQELLEMRFPGQSFEVINAGANGQGAAREAAVVAEVVRAEPDLVVVVTGNNEGLAPVGTVAEALNQWILYRAVKSAVLSAPDRSARPEYPPQTASASTVAAAFRENLATMLATARTDGVPIVFGTQPINLLEYIARVRRDAKLPLGSRDAGCAPVDAAVHARMCEEAARQSAACADPLVANVTVAECFRDAGDVTSARALLYLSVDVDPRGRARPSYNAAIREIAHQPGATLSDLDAMTVALSPTGIPGDRYFIDRVHLTCMGYLRIARTLVDDIVAAGLLPDAWGPALPNPTADAVLSKYPWNTATSAGRVGSSPNCLADPAAE